MRKAARWVIDGCKRVTRQTQHMFVEILYLKICIIFCFATIFFHNNECVAYYKMYIIVTVNSSVNVR